MDAPMPFHEKLPSPDENPERNTTPNNTTTSEQDRNHIYNIEEQQQESQPYVHPSAYNDDRTEESEESLK